MSAYQYLDTFSVLLYLDGTFQRQVTRLSYVEASDFARKQIADGNATRAEVWNEYHDQLEIEF